MRILPIFDEHGATEMASLKAWCYLLFPEAEFEAIRAYDCLRAENLAIKNGDQPGYGEIGKAVQKALLSRMKFARLSGLVFYQMTCNAKERGQLDFNKAVFSVAEFASRTKTKGGKHLPGDESRLSQKFKEYRSALCYWAAFELLEHEDQLTALEDEGAFQKWMLTTAAIEKRAINLRLHEDKQALSDWNPWYLPEHFHRVLNSGLFNVVLPEEPEVITKRIQTYRREQFKK